MSPSIAQPSGASVVAGQAAISAPNAATTLITQSSQKAIINWQSFSVAGGRLVQFAQPNASAITLNRVTGGAPSAIDGAIRANGQVWLINPNGVLFGQGARIHVGGLLATTSDIADGDFLSGNYSFASSSNAAVVNNGTIHARKGGSVVLSGASVANGGLIEAKAGHIVLGGADAFTVDFTGDHLLSYAVTRPVARQTTDANGNPQSASVTNTGIIRAAGGKVLMTARAAANIADGVVNNSGMVEATSARVENGEIILDAGDGNAISSGTLNASGKKAGQTGGSVEVLGQTVAIADGAKIDVSGDAGGGQALIGGNFHGAGPQANAITTTVGKATINADAIHTGNGGKVAVWSNGRTGFAGSISAKGGAKSGNGGQVETSGHNLAVSEDAIVTTLGANGVSGSWLLDPHNITIASNGSDPASPQGFSDNPASDVTISPTTLANALANGTVNLQANTDITVASSITVSGGTGNTLGLYAGRSIQLTNSSSINFASGILFLSANDPGAVSNRDPGVATISSGSLGSVTASKVALILNSNGLDGSSIGSSGTPFTVSGSSPTYIQTSGANAYVSVPDGSQTSFTLGNPVGNYAVNMTGGNLFIRAAGVTQTDPILVNNLTVTLPNSISSGNAVLLNDANNVITGTVNIAAMGGSPFSQGGDYIQLVNSQALTLGVINEIPNISSTDRGNITLTATNGALTLTGNIDAGQITLNGWGITQTGGVIYAHASSGGASSMAINATNGGSLSLPDANVIEQFVASTNNGSETAVSSVGQLVFISAGSANVNFASSLQLQGAYAQSGDLSITTTGSYNLSDSGGNLVKKYNSIIVNNPISATGLVTLHAAGPIVQNVGRSANVAIAATGLSATSDTGPLMLTDGGHAAGADDNNGPADAGNQIATSITIGTDGNGNPTETPASTVVLSGVGNVAFTNLGKTVLGAVNVAAVNNVGTLDIEVGDASGATVHSDLVLSTGVTVAGTGDTTLHATGNMINLGGASQVTADALNLISDYGNIGGSEPDNPNTSYFMGTTVNSLHVVTNGGGNDPFNTDTPVNGGFLLSNSKAFSIGTDQGGFNTGSGGGFIAASNNAAITQAGGTNGAIVTSGNLAVSTGTGGFTLTNSQNQVSGQLSLYSPGTSSFVNSGNTVVNQIIGSAFDQTASSAGAVTLTVNNGSVTEAGGGLIKSGSLNVSTIDTACGSCGNPQPYDIMLTGANTQVGALTLNSTGNISFANTGALILGSSSAGGTFLAQAGTDLTIAAGATITAGGSGDAVVLVAGHSFINNAGSTAVNLTGGGRFLVYSVAPQLDTFNNLNSNNTVVWATSYPTTISASGSRYVFSGTPILSVTPGNATKTYGSDARGSIASNYTISSLLSAFPGAFLGDTPASVYSGTPTFSASGGEFAGGSVGSYAVTLNPGSLTVMDGYVLQAGTGVLTVNPATLTYNANRATIFAGSAIPTLGGTVTGFVNGENQGSATTGSLLFSTNATSSSPAGSYAINGSGLNAKNYVFVQAAGNSTAFNLIVAQQTTAPITTTQPIATPPVTTTVPVVTTTAPPGAVTISLQPLLSFTASQPLTSLNTFLATLGLTPVDQTAPTITPSSLVIVTTAPPVANPIQDMVASSGNGDGAEPPTSSDVATNYVVKSMDGGGAPARTSPGNTPIVIPGLLHRVSGRAPGGGGNVNDSDLSSWGNAALWQ